MPQRQSQREVPASYSAGRQWLLDHLDELIEAPTRLHDHAIGDGGTPAFSAAFLAVLLGSPYATIAGTEKRACPFDHPIDAPLCTFCGGQFTYTVPTLHYRHPLAAALASLRKAPPHSPTWPRAYVMVVTLLREGLDLERAAAAVGHPVLSEDHRKTVEAAFLISIRKVVSRWSSGPIPRMTPISESQSIAENGEAAA